MNHLSQLAAVVPALSSISNSTSIGLGTVLVAAFLLCIALYFIFGITLSIIADKAGEKNGWHAWVPVLNFFLEFRIAGLSTSTAWLWFLGGIVLDIVLSFARASFIVQIIFYVLNIYIWMRICKRLGKSEWLGLLQAIPLVDLGLMIYLAAAKTTPITAPAAVSSVNSFASPSVAATLAKMDSLPVDMGVFNFIKNSIAAGKSKEEILASLASMNLTPAQFDAAYDLAMKEAGHA